MDIRLSQENYLVIEKISNEIIENVTLNINEKLLKLIQGRC